MRDAALQVLGPLALVGVAALTGCTGWQPDVDGAVLTADTFLTAVAAGDGDAACAALSRHAREDLEQDSGDPCETAVLAENVHLALTESHGAVPAAAPQAFGRQALVVTSRQVVFLARDGDRWAVTAAGCVPREGEPYDCAIEGS